MARYPTSALVVSFDDNYKPFANFLLFCLDKFVPSEIAFFLFTPSDTKIDKSELNKISAQRKITHIPIEYGKIDKVLPVVGHFTLSMYGRLLIPKLLPQEVEQSLYLDIDVLVRNDLEELFKIKISKPIGAVAAQSTFSHLVEPLDECDTFYSGLLLINHLEWRKSDIFNRCLKIIEIGKEKLSYPDNDLLVIALNTPKKGNWQELPIVYNYMNYNEKSETRRVKNPSIVHFPGADKPWNSPFGGKYAREWRREFRRFDENFRLTPRSYVNFIYRRVKDLSYNKIFLRASQIRSKLITEK